MNLIWLFCVHFVNSVVLAKSANSYCLTENVSNKIPRAQRHSWSIDAWNDTAEKLFVRKIEMHTLQPENGWSRCSCCIIQHAPKCSIFNTIVKTIIGVTTPNPLSSLREGDLRRPPLEPIHPTLHTPGLSCRACLLLYVCYNNLVFCL